MMTIKIKKNVLGEEYIFRVSITPKDHNCTFRIQGSENNRIAFVSLQYDTILFKEPITLCGYINDVISKAPTKNIVSLKLNRQNSLKVKEYITGKY